MVYLQLRVLFHKYMYSYSIHVNHHNDSIGQYQNSYHYISRMYYDNAITLLEVRIFQLRRTVFVSIILLNT